MDLKNNRLDPTCAGVTRPLSGSIGMFLKGSGKVLDGFGAGECFGNVQGRLEKFPGRLGELPGGLKNLRRPRE